MKKRIIIFCFLIMALLLTACGNIGNSVTGNKNPKVTFESVSNSFYYEQLNEDEIQGLEEILAMCQTYKGGVLELTEPISFNSWLRIVHTLNFDYEKRFWPLVMLYPYDEKGKAVNENSEEKNVSKIYVQLNDVEDNEAIKAFRLKYSAEGRLLNEEGLLQLMQNTTINEDDYIEKNRQIEEVEQEIIAGMPKDIGQRDAVIYFCNWIKDNMEYDSEVMYINADAEENTSLYPNEYGNVSYRQCILQRKAVCGGLATILSDLCNQVGIPSYVVIGTIAGNGQSIQHGWVAVEIGGQTLYIDPTYVVTMKRMDMFCTKEQLKTRSDGRCYIFTEVFEY